MKVRIYKAPHGRIEDRDIAMAPEDANRIAALEARHVYPAVEVLRVTGEYSVTLEADDLEEDLFCDIVPADKVAETVRRMVRAFDPAKYDARTA